MQSLISASEALHHFLIKTGYKLATAESCTGGMVAATMTDRAGSSDFFDRGFVTYSNAAKQDMLGVASLTLDNHGAVSEETAGEMAQGAKGNSLADLSLSITGIAGPGGGTADKPVGTVCFGWTLTNDETTTSTQHFSGNREEVRQQAAAFAVEQLLRLLEREES